MVYFMENPIKMDDLGVPLFFVSLKYIYKYVIYYESTIAFG